MKLFRNRFFLVCLTVALVFTAVATTFSIMGYRGLVSDVVGTVTMPFRVVGGVFVKAFRGFQKYFGSIRTLRERNEQLQQENEALRLQIDDAERIAGENEHLRVYLGMKASDPGLEMTNASVIGRESSGAFLVYTLNRGSVHGIEVNMPVMTEIGLVGVVAETGMTWCRVTTLLEPRSAVGCYLPEDRGSGIVMGDYTRRLEGLCKLTYISPTEADVRIGDVVRSSGIGSVYPPDTVIGTVVEVEPDATTRSVIAWVRPAVDFDSIDNMMIVTGYRKNAG